MKTAQSLIAQAKSWLGIKEGTNEHKQIINLYNSHKPLARGYKVTYNDAWCAAFVSACAIATDMTDIIPTECGCQEMFNSFKIKKDRNYTPSMGDIIFYDWNNDGHTQHVGIVESCIKNIITVIEGNHNDAVGRRTIQVGNATIKGYGIPQFKKEEKQKTMTNEEIIWDFLFKWIKNAYGTAGLMGNIRAESALRPTNLQDRYETSLKMSDEEYTAAVDNGSYPSSRFINDSAGYGLAQWTFWSRKKALYNYMKNRNLSIGDLQGQLDFLKKEIEENYPTLITSLKNAKSVRQASNNVLFIYERPGDQSQRVQDLRTSYGENYYNKFGARQMSINRNDFLNAVDAVAKQAKAKHWRYGNSQSTVPCDDGYISCDRLVSRVLYKYFNVKNQHAGGWNTRELSQHLPNLGFTKITDQSKLQGGDIVMIGHRGKNDPTYHTFVLAEYNPSNGICKKYDMGDQWRIDSNQPFVDIQLNEWGGEKYFSMAFRPAASPSTPQKTKIDIIKQGQIHSIEFTGHNIKIDGDPEDETKGQKYRVLRHAMNLDYFGDEKISEDKRDSALFRKALEGHYVEKGEVQYMVKALEILLELKGIDPNGVEKDKGEFGLGLERALGKSRVDASDFINLCK